MLAEFEKSQFDARAEELAARSYISGNRAYDQLDYFGLTKSDNYNAPWKNYQGKKILDVGAGVSDFTAKLLEKGADAYAVDYGYKDLDAYIARISHWRAEGQRFLRLVQANPQRYVYGLAHDLPFAADTFDAVTSYFGIIGAMDKDVEVAQSCMDEAIRVLKPGGILQVGPLFDVQFTQEQKTNQQALLEILAARRDIDMEVRLPRGLRTLISSGSVSDMGKITIIKNI